MRRWAPRLAREWSRVFPEKRELIIRTDGHVRYVCAPRVWQVAAAGTLMLAAGWGAIATYGFVYNAGRTQAQARIIDGATSTIAALRDERAQLQTALDELAGAKLTQPARAWDDSVFDGRDDLVVRVAALGGELDQLFEVRRELERALNHAPGAETFAESATSRKVAALAAREREHVSLEAALRAEVRSLKTEVSHAATTRALIEEERAALSDKVALLQQQSVEQVALRRSARTKVRRLETELASLKEEQLELETERGVLAGRVDSLGTMLASLGKANRSLLASLDERVRERDDLSTEVARLNDRLIKLQRDQVGVLARLDARASDSVETMQRIVGMTGLDPQKMLDRIGAPPLGRGGPFVELASAEPASLLESQIDELDARVEQWRGLRDLIERLPLTAPLDGYQVTSPFGSRKDPFSGRLAMHDGADFIGKSRALILAPAPGKVTFVGFNGGYGKMVEVDHGLGIRTRYGHMNKIYVKRGQEVDFRQRLGQMGNTGRSTAEHLHYEILVDGMPVDPEAFLRAGVFAFSG